MYWVALKMLTADRTKFIGMAAGVALAALLMAQQPSIACGMLLRTTAQIRDVADVDVWVVNEEMEQVEELKPLPKADLYRVRCVPGVAWAVPLYLGQGRLKLDNGSSQQVILLGLDDPTLVGAPQEMVLGKTADLRLPDAVVMDERGYEYLWPGESMRLGKHFEMNDHRLVLVGVCKASDTYQTFPVLYTRYSLAVHFVPQGRQAMSAVLVGAQVPESSQEVCRRIEEQTGRKAVTRGEFIWLTISYFLRRTGIMANFAFTTGLAFLVGCAILGQTFYTLTLENLPQFGMLKAMGVGNRRLVGMLLFQAFVVGLLGYCPGVGLAALSGEVLPRISRVPFHMPWQVLAGTAGAVASLVVLSCLASLRPVLLLEPAVVFRGSS